MHGNLHAINVHLERVCIISLIKITKLYIIVLQKCIREISRKRLIECWKQTWVIRRNVGSRSFLEGGFYDGKEKYCGVVGRLRTEYNKASNSTVKVIHRGMFTRIEIFPRFAKLRNTTPGRGIKPDDWPFGWKDILEGRYSSVCARA